MWREDVIAMPGPATDDIKAGRTDGRVVQIIGPAQP